MTTKEQQNEQLKDQYKAVAHLARSIAELCDEMSTLVGHGHFQNLVEMEGAKTHFWMDQLGDMLNCSDACEEDDEWIDPIFEGACRVFPLEVGD